MAAWMTAGVFQNGKTQEVADATDLALAHIGRAKVVAESAPDLVEGVVAGSVSLADAYTEARKRKADASSADAQMVKLCEKAPDLANLVTEERMTLTEAIAALDQRLIDRARKRREAKESAARLNEFAAHAISVIAAVEATEPGEEPITISRDLRANVEKALRLLDERNVQTR